MSLHTGKFWYGGCTRPPFNILADSRSWSRLAVQTVYNAHPESNGINTLAIVSVVTVKTPMV